MVVVPEPGSPIRFAPFEVVDEEYTELDIDDVTVVARSASGEPLVWFHEVDGRRAAVSLLGHDARSLGHPAHRRLLADLVDHLVPSPTGEGAGA